MGQSIQKIKLLGSMQVDAHSTKVKPYESRYNLNLERSINNLHTALALGENAGNNTPTPGNRIINITGLPFGVNTVIGSHYSNKTNEEYVCFHNEQGNHGIYRINGDLSVQMVLVDPKLNFQLDPRHYFKNRMYLFFNHNNFTVPVNRVFNKYLVMVDGFNWQYFIDVETAIATNGFRVPYFNTPDRTQLWQLPTRPSLKCITGEYIPIPPNDADELAKANLIADNIWQFRIAYDYYDGRPTSYGPISDAFLQQASGCQSDAKGRPRCIRLTLDAGGPQVERIRLLFRNCAGNFTNDQDADWNQTAIIEKYNQCLDSNTVFYLRSIRTDFAYNPTNNTFQYTFCNEGTCIPVDPRETRRNYNPIPQTNFGLAPLDDRLMLLNYTEGFTPISCETLDKFAVTVTEPLGTECQVEMATIKVSVIIHNFFRNQNQFIWTYEDENSDDKEMNRRLFGGLGPRATTTAFDDPPPYKQYFKEQGKKAGFIAYVEGTDFYAVTKQYQVYSDGSRIEWTPGNMDNSGARRRISRDLSDRKFYFLSEAEIKVPKGTAGFIRLASHLSSKSDQFKNTSTTVIGIMNNRQVYNAETRVSDRNTNLEKYEIFFNSCSGDIDLTSSPFVVADLTGPYGDFNISNPVAATAFDGYFHDQDGRPIEGAVVRAYGGVDGEFSVMKTDHNGYYFASQLFPDNFIFFSPIGSVIDALTRGNTGAELFVEGPGCERIRAGENILRSGSRPNSLFSKDIEVSIAGYEDDFYTMVRVKVIDTNNVAIPGVAIALEGRKSKETGSDGYATLFVRNDMLRYGQQMTLNMVPMQNGVCYLTTGNCDSCMPVVPLQFQPCFSGPLEIVYDTLPKFNQILPVKGLSPGTYPVALKFMDAAGRETFWQGDYSVEIPSFQKKGKYTFSNLRWQVTGQMKLPKEFVKMSIGVARNRNHQDFLTWIVDEVEFIDAAGQTATNLSADKIRLSIKSLFDFNTRSGYATNAKYIFEPGDMLQFVANGDGKLFSLPADQLQFQIEADYNNRDLTLEDEEDRYSKLVVSYSKELKDLTEGSQIMLIKPRKCDTEDLYFESCPLIDIIDGEPANNIGGINIWDSYLVRRKITYNDQPNVFTFPFLHHSPSDFWGDHCISRGRFGVKNPYEKRVQYGRHAKLSDALLQNGNLNGLGTFRPELVKRFTGEQRGDIVAAISREQFILVICEYDWFVSMVADDFLRVAQDGTVRSSGGDAVVSDAQSRAYGNYGCQYDDISAIQEGDGWCFWVDSTKHAPVLCDFQTARDVSVGSKEEPLMKSYFSKKIQYKNEYNASQEARQFPAFRIKMFSGYDPVAKNVLLTFFNKGNGGSVEDYVHSDHFHMMGNNQTIAFNPFDGTFPTMYSFTPEFYGVMPNSKKGNVFFSMKNGLPWVHREIGATVGFMTFFGVACDQVVEPVVNMLDDKMKVFLAMQQQSKMPYYAEKIVTDQGQESRIPVSWFINFDEGKHSVEFLRAENSIRGLFTGDQLRGYSLTMRLVRDNTVNFKKNTIDPVKQAKYNELDSIIVKFMLSEQSAYNANNA